MQISIDEYVYLIERAKTEGYHSARNENDAHAREQEALLTRALNERDRARAERDAMMEQRDEAISRAGLPSSEALTKELLRAFRQGHKIRAIKAYRSLTARGLREAKDAIEWAMAFAPDEN